MIKLDTARRQKRLQDIIDRKHEAERIEMNLRELTDRELTDLINNTGDLKLLAKAEDEYVRRNTNDIEADELYDEDVMTEIFKSWRPG